MPDGTVTPLECPKDGGTMLVAVDRNGVTIDACPRCRGIWLDRGELDKLIDLEAAVLDDFADEVRGVSRGARREDRAGQHGSSHSSHGSDHTSTKRRKRGGFLSDTLDFG